LEITTLKSRIASGVFWIGLTKILGQTISWLITIFVVRILTPEDYGLMGMAVLFTSLLQLFNELGLGTAIVQKENISQEELSSIHWAIIIINACIYLFVVIFSPVISNFFSEPKLTSLIQILGISFLINAFGLTSSYMLMKNLSFKKRSQAELFGNILGAISTFLFAINNFGVWSLVYGYLIQETIKNIFYILYCNNNILYKFSFNNIKKMILFGLKIMFSRILWYISSNADFMIAGKYLGKTLFGYYTLAFQFASIPIDKIVTIVTQVALPSFSEIQDDLASLQRYYLKMVNIIAFVTFPLFLGLFLVADSGVILFLTEKWRPMIIPMKILCIVSCLRAIGTLNAPLVVAKGKPNILLANCLLQAIILPYAFYLGAKFGLNGLSFAWLLTYPFLHLIITFQTLQLLQVSFWQYVKEMKHGIFGTAIMVLVCTVVKYGLLLGKTNTVNFFVITCAGMTIYLLYSVLFNREIISEVVGIIKSRNKLPDQIRTVAHVSS